MFVFPPLAKASQRESDEWKQYEVEKLLPVLPPEYTTIKRDARLRAVSDQIGGSWQMIQNDATGVARFVLGSGGDLVVPTDGSDASYDATARDFIDQNPGLFGVATTNLQLLAVNHVKGKTAVLYQQVYRGVPVQGGVVRVYFHGNSRIVGFGSDAHPGIDIAVKPTLSEGAARAAGSGGLAPVGGNLRQTKSELRIVPQYSSKTDVAYRLVWDSNLEPETEGPSWDVIVDAHSGQMIHRKARPGRSTGERTRIEYDFDTRSSASGNVTGYVWGEVYSPVGQALELADNPPPDLKDIKPLPYIKVTVGEDNSAVEGYTDETGFYSINYTGQDPTTVTVGLEGLYAKVEVEGEPEAELTTPFDPANPGQVDFTFEFSSASPNARADELNAYYHVSVMHKFVNDIVSRIDGIDFAAWQELWDYRIPVTVNCNNLQPTCNATGGRGSLKFGRCDVSTNPSLHGGVIYHEYGHTLYRVASDFVGLFLVTGGIDGPVDEGNADLTGYLQINDRINWRGYGANSVCESGNRDLASDVGYYDDIDVDHDYGIAIAGFYRDLYLAWGGTDVIGEDCDDIQGDLWEISHNDTRDRIAELWLAVYFFDFPTDMLLQVVATHVLAAGTPEIAGLCDAAESREFFYPGDIDICFGDNEYDTDWVDLSELLPTRDLVDDAQFSLWTDIDGGGFPDLVRGTIALDNSKILTNENKRHKPRISYILKLGNAPLSNGDSYVRAVAFADYNKDGMCDKILAKDNAPNVILDGRGGIRITPNTDQDLTHAVSWGDHNNDGALDLFVGNINSGSHDGTNNLYQYDPVEDEFTDVAPASIAAAGDVYAAVWADFDNNGLVDLFLALDATIGTHKLFLNFSDATGPSFDEHPVPEGAGIARSIACDDYDRDGLMDIALVTASNELFILRNQGGGEFNDETAALGLAAVSGNANDIAWGDFDNDGWVDLYAANISGVPDELWQNEGNVGGVITFSAVTGGPWEEYSDHSQCVAWGDHDVNGVPDIAVFGATGANDHVFSYLKNTNNWLTIRLRGNRSNAEAIGAVVTINYGGDSSSRQLVSTHGLGANDPALHFGLGAYEGTADVTIDWPSGEIQQIDGLDINQRITIEEPAFELVTGGDVASTAYTRGIAWGDLDGDGDLDLYLGNETSSNQILLYDDSTGTFVDATGIGDAASPADTRGINLIDYDNDGDLDIYLSVVGGPNELIRNNGGLSFDRVAADNELVSLASDCRNAAWADYDNDGLLDLYVVNYQGANHLMQNQGLDASDEPVFAEVPAPVLRNTGHGTSAAWGDANLDNRIDLYIVNDDTANPNRILINLGNGVFEDANEQAPILADDGCGYGAAWVDYDDDGSPDLYLSNNGANRIFRNRGIPAPGISFEDVTENADLLGLADDGDGGGVTWGDYDNNGFLDVYLSKIDEPNRLIRYVDNNNGSKYIDESSFVVWDAGPGHAAAWADYDDDGDLDLYHSRYQGANQLYENAKVTTANWLKIKLASTASNADAIGARVIVRLGQSGQITRSVGGDAGFMSQNPTEIHLGLGADQSADRITVIWPSGVKQVSEGLWQNETVTVTEPDQAPFDATHLGQVYLSFEDRPYDQRVVEFNTSRPGSFPPPDCNLGDARIEFKLMVELDFSDLGPEFGYLNDVAGLRDYHVEVVTDPGFNGGVKEIVTPTEYCFIPGEEGQNHRLLVSYVKCLEQLPSPPPFYPSNVRIRIVPLTAQRISAVPWGPSPDWDTCGDYPNYPTNQVGFYPEWASNWIIINPDNPTIPRVEHAVHSGDAQIALVFDEFMNEGTASNYAVTQVGNPGNSIAVTQVTRLTDYGYRNVIVLDLDSEWPASEAYEVTITGLTDLEGDALPVTTVPVLEPGAGQIAISEIMAKPSYGDESEWFEIVNYGDTEVDINGWKIRDEGGESHVISAMSPLLIGPGEHKVLARNAGPLSGIVPGIDIIYEYGGFITLDDDEDEIILETDSGREIDRVAYGPGWPLISQVSMQWDMTGDNADPANWGFTGPAFGLIYEAGTPSSANVLQDALSGTLPAGGGTVFYSGALLVEGDITIESGSSVTFENGSRIFVSDTDALASGLDPATVEWNVTGELVFDGGSGIKNTVGIHPPASNGTWGPIILGGGYSTVSPVLTADNTSFTGMSTGLVKTGSNANASVYLDRCDFDVSENGIELYDLDDGDDIMVNVCNLNGPGVTPGNAGIIAEQATVPGAGPSLTIQGFGTITDFWVGIDMFVENNATISHITTSTCGFGIQVVDAGASVTLGPSLTLTGNYGTGLLIDGGAPTITGITVEGGNADGLLVINGAEPVFDVPTSYFRYNQTGIKLDGASEYTVVQNVTVDDNSSSGVYIVDCSPTIEQSVEIFGGTVGVQVSGEATPLIKPVVTSPTVGVYADTGAIPKLRAGKYNNFLYGIFVVNDASANAGKTGSPGANEFNPTPMFYYYLLNLTTNTVKMQQNCYDGSANPPAIYFSGPVIYLPGLCLGGI
jgi:hypothetical protein